MQLNVAGLIRGSRANGPGERTVVHFQGCQIRCDGCFNKWSWKDRHVHMLEVDELAKLLLDNNPEKGITLSGGEPMDQQMGLAQLVRRLRELEPDCTILMFTGYSQEQLRNLKFWPQIRDHLDVAIAGPYLTAQATEAMGLVSSLNQQVLLLSDRYGLQDLVSPARVEVLTDPTGEMVVTGFPSDNLINQLKEGA